MCVWGLNCADTRKFGFYSLDELVNGFHSFAYKHLTFGDNISVMIDIVRNILVINNAYYLRLTNDIKNY